MNEDDNHEFIEKEDIELAKMIRKERRIEAELLNQ